MPTTPDILTVAEVARYMRISRDTVYRLAAAGELRGRKIGRIWRFPKSAIEAYVYADAPLQQEAFKSKSDKQGAGRNRALTLSSGEPPGTVP